MKHIRKITGLLFCILSCSLSGEDSQTIKNEKILSLAEIKTLFEKMKGVSEKKNKMKIKTSTPWTETIELEGPLMSDVLDFFDIKGSKIKLISTEDYAKVIDRKDIEKYNAILAFTMNGKEMDPSNRGPFWMMYPFDSTPEIQNKAYYLQCIWQIKEIRVE